MSNELGKLDKPEAAPFQKKRRLYLVPLVFQFEGAPAEYVGICGRYWEGVRAALESLEAGAGRVSRIYHEAVPVAGQEGLRIMEKMNPRTHELAKPRCEAGAVLEALEDDEGLEEYLDWQRCLVIGLMSRNALEKVSRFYAEASRRRFEHMSRKIGQTLEEEEAGLLFISEEHKVQFPENVEVFYIAPPELDEVHRWLRERSRHKEDAAGEGN